MVTNNQHGTWTYNFFFELRRMPSNSLRCHLLSPSSRPSTGLTWCLPAVLNYGVQCIVHWLWRQWHLSSTANVCARPVTHEFGLRTIPFGYLHSTNCVQSYRVSLNSEGCHQTPFTVICSHHCLLSPSSRPSTGLTWCLPAALNYGVQRIVHWLWRQ